MTVKDIVRDQQAVTMRNSLGKHFQEVWDYRSFLNLSYSTMTLTPDQTIETGVDYNHGIVPEFKSKWGVSLKWGRSYRLHTTPIANVATFNIDYTWIDLNVNYFEQEAKGTNAKLYDSSQKFDKSSGSVIPSTNSGFSKAVFRTPWNLEKYEANYGMSLGPSLTLAPFTYIDVPELHFIKFHVYYHIGYHVSGILMTNNEAADKNTATTGNLGDAHDEMKESTKIDWGHGMTSSFGFNISWRLIGFGYESRNASVKYTSILPSSFGNDEYKFKTSLNRIYFQFRF